MRFRRVKWAAMEFLLKAQKKMHRRKILEQLLLLFLRMLLVFLVGLLFSRFVGFGQQQKETRRPFMSSFWMTRQVWPISGKLARPAAMPSAKPRN